MAAPAISAPAWRMVGCRRQPIPGLAIWTRRPLLSLIPDGNHAADLLANHGPVVAGKTLDQAAGAIEELEETAKLLLLLKDVATKPLTKTQVDALQQRFPPAE